MATINPYSGKPLLPGQEAAAKRREAAKQPVTPAPAVVQPIQTPILKNPSSGNPLTNPSIGTSITQPSKSTTAKDLWGQAKELSGTIFQPAPPTSSMESKVQQQTSVPTSVRAPWYNENYQFDRSYTPRSTEELMNLANQYGVNDYELAILRANVHNANPANEQIDISSLPSSEEEAINMGLKQSREQKAAYQKDYEANVATAQRQLKENAGAVTAGLSQGREDVTSAGNVASRADVLGVMQGATTQRIDQLTSAKNAYEAALASGNSKMIGEAAKALNAARENLRTYQAQQFEQSKYVISQLEETGAFAGMSPQEQAQVQAFVQEGMPGVPQGFISAIAKVTTAKTLGAAQAARFDTLKNTMSMLRDNAQAGIRMSNPQMISISQQTGIPVADLLSFNDVAQSILSNKNLDNATKQAGLESAIQDLDLKARGIYTNEAKNVSTLEMMYKNGTNPEIIKAFKNAAGIKDMDDPMYQAQYQKQLLDNEISKLEYGVKTGQIIPGSPADLDYQIKTLERKKLENEINQYAGTAGSVISVNDKTVKDIFYQQGPGRYKGADNKRECGEAYNDITDGPKVGNDYATKMASVVKRDSPNIGNGLVIPLTVNGALSYGHIETVIGFDPNTQQVKTVSWNRDGNGSESIQTYTIPELKQKYGDNWGFTDSKLKPQYQQAVTNVSAQTTPSEYKWVNTAIANAFGDAEGGKAATRKQQEFQKAISEGDKEGAKSIAYNAILSTATNTERAAFEDAVTLDSAYGKMKSAIDALEKAGMDTGFTGSKTSDLYKWLTAKRPKEAVELDQRLVQAFNSYRKAITGAGASVGELEQLKTGMPTFEKNLQEIKQMTDIIKGDARESLDRKVNIMSRGAFKDYNDMQNKLNQIAPSQEQKQADAVKGVFSQLTNWMTGNAAKILSNNGVTAAPSGAAAAILQEFNISY